MTSTTAPARTGRAPRPAAPGGRGRRWRGSPPLTLLAVEAPHVTRQVQRLQQAGYADRVPDPDDRRAQLIQLTPAGKAASDRIREAGTAGMQAALAHWPPHELRQLATLLHRMVDDFLAYSAADQPGQPAR